MTWVAANGEQLGADSGKLTVMGDSAGGNLAAACALMTRDREGPALQRQVLIYPILDYNFDTDSYLRYMEGFHLTRDAMIWFWDLYAPQRAQREQAYAAPLRADDLSDLAPALIIVAECDPLLDEGEAYAKRLLSAGNAVDVWRYPGTIHGFIRRTKLWAHARECLRDLAEALGGPKPTE
jgi:acetyl esterase